MALAVVAVAVAALGLIVGYVAGSNTQALNAAIFIGVLVAFVAGLAVGHRLAGAFYPFEWALVGAVLGVSWGLGVAGGSRLRRGRTPLATPDAEYPQVRETQGVLSALFNAYYILWWTAISCFVGVAWLVAAEGWVKVFALVFFAFGAWVVLSTIRSRARS